MEANGSYKYLVIAWADGWMIQDVSHLLVDSIAQQEWFAKINVTWHIHNLSYKTKLAEVTPISFYFPLPYGLCLQSHRMGAWASIRKHILNLKYTI